MRGLKRHASFIMTDMTYWAAMRNKSRGCPLMIPATACELLLWIINFILIIITILIVSLQLYSLAGKGAGSVVYVKFSDLSVHRSHRLGGMCMQNAGCQASGPCLASCSVQTEYDWGGTWESASLSNISVDSDAGGMRTTWRNTDAKPMCALSPIHLDTMHLSTTSGA